MKDDVRKSEGQVGIKEFYLIGYFLQESHQLYVKFKPSYEYD